MEWVDAILYALVAVYLINTFFFQNYKIPSSSLEKTLLVGDYLFVSKLSFGPRVPEHSFIFSAGAAYNAGYQHKVLYRVAAMALSSSERFGTGRTQRHRRV